MNVKARLGTAIGGAAAAMAIAVVMHFEGYMPIVYQDPIGRLAVCYGHDDPSLKAGTTYTAMQCEDMLAEDLAKHAEALACIHVPMTDGQKAAFVSFAYNVGTRAFCGSTLVRLANAGDMKGACEQLPRWNKARGITLPGLVRRRAAERALCLQDGADG